MSQLKELQGLLEQTLQIGKDNKETLSNNATALVEVKDDLKAKGEALEAMKARQEDFEKQLEEIKNLPTSDKVGIELKGLDAEGAKKFSFSKAVGGICREAWGQRDAWEGAKFEQEILEETRKAAHQESVDISGGWLVPMQVTSDFIEILRNRLVLEQDLGARVLTGLTGTPVPIPKHTGGAQAYWLSENGIPGESDLTFGSVNLEPRRCAGFVTISNRLLDMAPALLESLVREELAETLARKVEEGFFFGNGGVEPRGLINIPGVQRIQLDPGTGRRFNFDDAEIHRLTIEEKNVQGEIRSVSRPSVWSLMKRLKIDHFAGQTENQGYLLGRPPVTDTMLREMLGHQFAKTTALPVPADPAVANSTYVISGVWRDFLLAFWKRMVLRASRDASLGNRSSFLQNETWLVVETAADCNVRHTESFVYTDDALTV